MIKLVLIAGPNDPEVIDYESSEGKKALALAIAEFGPQEIDLWYRFKNAGLVEGYRTQVETISTDDAFVYMRGHWKFWNPNPEGNDVTISLDWDYKRR